MRCRSVRRAGGRGVGDHHVKKFDLGFVWDPKLTWWRIGDWHFALIGESNVAWWHTNEGDVHDDNGEIGLTPVIRFTKSSGSVRLFLEVGAGVRLLTSPRISSDFTLGTAFQFAELAGVGSRSALISNTRRATASSMFPMAVSKSRILV